MRKLLLFVALVALVAIMACGEDEATEVPESTTAPEPTPAAAAAQPAATPQPAPTTAPQPTEAMQPQPTEAMAPAPTEAMQPAPTEAMAPAPTAPPVATQEPEPAPTTAMDSGNMIRPLKLEDPLTIASELSEAELACTAGVAPIERLLQIFDAPETGTPEELSRLFGCFEDETVLRMFLTTLIGLSDPLSGETSQCVRDGMEGMDVRGVMLSGSMGDPAAAMMGGMASMFLTVSCLNDEEFAATAPGLGFTSDDREGLQCVMEAMGGPEAFAATLAPGDPDAILGLFGAAAQCGVEIEGDPGMVGGPPVEPPPTPGLGQGPEETQMMALAGILSDLSPGEQACMASAGISPEMLQDPSLIDSATAEQQGQVLGCLENDTLTSIFLSGFVQDRSQLSDDTNACINTGMEGVNLRSVMMSDTPGDEEAAMVAGMSAIFLTVSCLNDEEFAASASALGFSPGDRESLNCVMETLGGPEGFAAALAPGDQSAIFAIFGAAAQCGLQMEGLAPPSG